MITRFGYYLQRFGSISHDLDFWSPNRGENTPNREIRATSVFPNIIMKYMGIPMHVDEVIP